MDDRVRESLALLIAEHGRSICGSPCGLALMLRQQVADADSAVDLIESALNSGCVEPLLTILPEHADRPALVQKLMDATGMPTEHAEWTMDAWIQALMREKPESSGLKRDWSDWNRLDVAAAIGGGAGMRQRSVSQLIVMAVAGGSGGAALGIGSLFRDDWRAADWWKRGLADLPPDAHVPSMVALGILGGAAGGLLGWMLSSGESLGGTPAGRPAAASIAAFAGAACGAIGGFFTMGLIGLAGGALAGGLFGVIVGVMAADALARFWN